MAKNNFEVGFVFGAKKAASFDKTFGSINQSIGGIVKGVVGMAGAYVSFNAIKDAATQCVQEAKDMIVVETKLEAVLQNVVSIQEKGTNYYKDAAASLAKTADAYEKVGVISADVTMAGMQQLATFQLGDKEIAMLTAGMTDLLAQQKGLNASQQDAVGIGNMIGKVMGGQVGALSKVGITFDAAQEKALKFGSATDRAAVLAEILQQNVGGVNEALAATDDGQIKKVDDMWGQVRETIGRKILPMQAQFAKVTLKALPAIEKAGVWAMDKIGAGIDWVLEKVDQFAPYIEKGIAAVQKFAADVTPGFGKAAATISKHFEWIKSVATESFGKIKAVIASNQPSFDKLKEVALKAGEAIQKGFELIKPAVEWIYIEGIPKVVEIILRLTQEAINFAQGIYDNWHQIKPIIAGIGAAFLAWNIPNILAGAVQGVANFSTALISLPATIGKVTAAQWGLVTSKVKDKIITLQLVGLYMKDFAVAIGKNVAGIAKATAAWVAQKATMLGTKAVTLALKGAQLISTGVTVAMTAAQWALNAAFIASPIGWVVLGIAALIAAGVLLWKNWDTIKAKGLELWAGMKTVFSNIQIFFGNMIANISAKFPMLGEALKAPIELIKGMIAGIKNVFSGLIDFVVGVFTGNWQKAWEGVKNIFGGIFDMMAASVKYPINAIIGIINAAITGINQLSFNVPDWVPTVGGKTVGFSIPTIPMLAQGGIATAPTLAMVGEGREKEAILPLSKLKGLLSESNLSSMTGAFTSMLHSLLGSMVGGGGDTIQFAPQLVFNGPTNESDVNRAMDEAYQKFVQYMEKYERNKKRTTMKRG